MCDYKIVQILPTPENMKSKYRDQDGYFSVPIVCMALVEYEDGQREVILMDMTDDGIISGVNIYDKDFIEVYKA